MFIYNQNLWNDLMSTVTLVLLSSVISIIIGVPLGILMAKAKKPRVLLHRFWTSCKQCLVSFT